MGEEEEGEEEGCCGGGGGRGVKHFLCWGFGGWGVDIFW